MSTSITTAANRKRIADRRAALAKAKSQLADAPAPPTRRAPRGTAPSITYRPTATTSRGGALHRSVDLVPGFTAATREPAHNPLRDLKRAWVKKYGATAGRQLWLGRTHMPEYIHLKAALATPRILK